MRTGQSDHFRVVTPKRPVGSESVAKTGDCLPMGGYPLAASAAEARASQKQRRRSRYRALPLGALDDRSPQYTAGTGMQTGLRYRHERHDARPHLTPRPHVGHRARRHCRI